MIESLDKRIVIRELHPEAKSGGESGDFWKEMK
jgi:molybdenum cofactor biosynthesis enzyme